MTKQMKIIGIGHYSRTGKDTFANYLLEAVHELNPQYRMRKQSFAWRLKQVTHELYGWAGLCEPAFYETVEGSKARHVKLPDLGLTPVEIWVKFGTDAVRNQVYGRTWIDCTLKGQTDCDALIIPDVRFPNEIEAIRELGGTLIKVVRPGHGPLPTVADQALIGWAGWDFVIGGSGNLAELAQRASEFARHLLYGTPVQQTDIERQAHLRVEVR